MAPTLVAGRATGLEWRVHMKNQCDRNIPVERHCTSIRIALITDEFVYLLKLTQIHQRPRRTYRVS
jgi:hypothetical protein